MSDYPISRQQLREMSVLAIEQRRHTIDTLTNKCSGLILSAAREGKQTYTFEVEEINVPLVNEIVAKLKSYYPDSKIYPVNDKRRIVISWI